MTNERVTYKFNLDRKTFYWSMIHIIIATAMGYALYELYIGGYFSAWFASFIGALFALMALSIPRKIEVTQSQVRILCILELTEINIDEIVVIRKINPRRMKWVIPIFGSNGFFGYYGYFVDLRRLEKFRMYATEWRNIVEIEDIYEDKYYLSCREGDKFIAHVNRLRAANSKTTESQNGDPI